MVSMHLSPPTGSIADYEGVNKVPKKTMTLIAVNTTAGTASEMTRFAIITDHARKVKMAIIDWYAAAHVTACSICLAWSVVAIPAL